MILIIDNYDSFSYNLYQLIGSIDPDIKVIRNDAMTADEVLALDPSAIILSPGPGRPADAGICEEIAVKAAGKVPVLGVCLGHQAITEAYGGVVGYAKQLMHGKQSRAEIDVSCDIFKGLFIEIDVARYHSLAAEEASLPEVLKVIARTKDGEIMAIKHKDYDKARKLFKGKLAPYLENDRDADDLSYALKIVLNSVYGMTAASFQNRFKDPRNNDNWVAKRGALFMEKLRREVQARGGHVIHIKTDSIKLVKPTQELQDFVIQFGKDYGYTFEIESRYERICLVNHAVYIALRQKDDPGWLKECSKAKKKAEETETPYIEPTRWTATGAQFAHPFVFKKLFSRRPMDFWDFCEVKTVKTALYLDMNEKLPDVTKFEKERDKIISRMKKLKKELEKPDVSQEDKDKIIEELRDLPKDIDALEEEIEVGHNYVFVGKAGEFMPVIPGSGGGLLMRKETDGSYGYATGAKGYRWVESESLRNLNDWKKYIDIRYFRGLTDVAIETIEKFCDFELFVKGEDGIILPEEQIVEYEDNPWSHPCGDEQYAYCSDCPDFENSNDGYYCKKGYDISKQILGESKESLV